MNSQDCSQGWGFRWMHIKFYSLANMLNSILNKSNSKNQKLVQTFIFILTGNIATFSLISALSRFQLEIKQTSMRVLITHFRISDKQKFLSLRVFRLLSLLLFPKCFSRYVLCCGNNNKDEDNSPKTLNDKNHQASSLKFRPLSRNLFKALCMFLYTYIRNWT